MLIIKKKKIMKKLHITLFLQFCLALVLLLKAYTVPPVSIETLLHTELEEISNKHNLPGMTATIVMGGGTAISVAWGKADKDYNIPMTTQSRMLAASIGKSFVAATCVALAQEGVLHLDSPATSWLGIYLWFSQLPNHDIITLRQLLNHTSGLPDHVFEEKFAKEFAEKWDLPVNPFLPETLVSYILNTEPRHEPGKGWSYSDTGYILAGLIIENATGGDFYEEVISRFIHPFGLNFTSPSDRRELPGLATGYLSHENAFGLPCKTTRKPGMMAWHPGIEWTGGGFISNSHDLAMWFYYLFSPNSDLNYIGKEMTNSVEMNKSDSLIKCGLGVFIQKNTPLGITYGHSGWIPGYRSNVQYYPEYDISVAFQINTDYGFEGDPIQVFDQIKWNLAKIAAQITGRQ
jgi:D-alanyl-D-alanine carboxypeptidase